jgi:hypothetical protein
LTRTAAAVSPRIVGSDSAAVSPRIVGSDSAPEVVKGEVEARTVGPGVAG